MDVVALTGKRIAVLGASRGIGAAAARAMAAAGARLALGARDGASLAALAASLPEPAFHRPCDVTQVADLAAWAEAGVAALGGLDGLLVTVTAGCSQSRPEDLDASYQLDFKAPLLAFEACRSALQASRGAVVFCSSRTAAVSVPQTLAYGSAKAALEYATRCLATRHLAEGLRVNAIAPGSTLTEDSFWAGQRAAGTALWQRTLAAMPQGRLANPEEIIAPILFLLSDQARWITGQTLLVDGGQCLFPHLPQ